MKHFTLCLFGKEVLSMAWGTEPVPGEEFVRLSGGDFEIIEDDLENVEVARRPIGFMA